MNHKLRIGCIPNSADFNHPQDRRRYIPYFRKKNIPYELADFDKDYDVLYVSISSDLNLWSQYKRKQSNAGKIVRVIFDLSDFYLASSPVEDFFRSIFYFLSGKSKILKFSFVESIKTMMSSSDVIICGSIEQQIAISKFHKNVIIVRDYFYDEIFHTKNSFELVRTDDLNILWEGFSHNNIETFKMIKDILLQIKNFNSHIHFVTDSNYCKIGGKFLCTPTFAILSKVFKYTKINFHLYDWNQNTFSSIASRCDFAIIPIVDDPIALKKPENKLLLLWTLGLPVITSSIASYKRVFDNIDETYYCSNIEEWEKNINILANSLERRKSYMKKAKEYIENESSEKIFLSTYDQIFFAL